MGVAHLATQELDRALAAWKYATELDPNAARAHAWLGGTLACYGSADAALDHIEAAIQLSPRDPAMWLFLDDGAFAHFVGRRYREAVDWAERSLKHRAERSRPYAVLAASHGLLGEEQAARSAAGELRRLAPDFSASNPGRLLSHDTDPSVATRLAQGLARAGIEE
jgi:tetratricopeptide (TPR) repeat protein